MIAVHLYGKLRRFAEDRDARSESIVRIAWEPDDTVSDVVRRIWIPFEELGSNLFVDGQYATLDSPVPDGARLGLFPDDMQLLYKWYFAPPKAARPSSRSAFLRPGPEDSAPGSGPSDASTKATA